MESRLPKLFLKNLCMEPKNTWEEAGNATGMGVDAIAEGIVGMTVGETKEIKSEFPKDFEISALASKTVTYSLEVHEIREKKAPQKDDEKFLKSLNLDSLDALKEKVIEQIKHRKDQENQNMKRKQITQLILDLPDFLSSASCGG